MSRALATPALSLPARDAALFSPLPAILIDFVAADVETIGGHTSACRRADARRGDERAQTFGHCCGDFGDQVARRRT
jgi:hypothetical protein